MMAQYGFKPRVFVVRTQPQYGIHSLPGELPEPFQLCLLKKKVLCFKCRCIWCVVVSHIKAESKLQHLGFDLEGALWCMCPPFSPSLYCHYKIKQKCLKKHFNVFQINIVHWLASSGQHHNLAKIMAVNILFTFTECATDICPVPLFVLD